MEWKARRGFDPNWQSAGGDVKSGRFEHLSGKVAPCGLTARRHHGTKTGPDNGHMLPGAAAESETCRGMYVTVAGVEHKPAFWQELMSSSLSFQNSAISNLLLVQTMHPFRKRLQS